MKGKKIATTEIEISKVNINSRMELEWRKKSESGLLESVEPELETVRHANSTSIGKTASAERGWMERCAVRVTGLFLSRVTTCPQLLPSAADSVRRTSLCRIFASLAFSAVSAVLVLLHLCLVVPGHV